MEWAVTEKYLLKHKQLYKYQKLHISLAKRSAAFRTAPKFASRICYAKLRLAKERDA